MSTPDTVRMALLETVLTRTAETLGDPTVPAMELFYSRHPETRAAFEHHGLGKRERLEAEMVDTVLYCVMTWLERPIEVAIMLYGSVPHHNDTLHVRVDWYTGLLNSVIDVIVDTIPPSAADEAALMEEIREGLAGAITEARGGLKEPATMPWVEA